MLRLQFAHIYSKLVDLMGLKSLSRQTIFTHTYTHTHKHARILTLNLSSILKQNVTVVCVKMVTALQQNKDEKYHQAAARQKQSFKDITVFGIKLRFAARVRAHLPSILLTPTHAL